MSSVASTIKFNSATITEADEAAVLSALRSEHISGNGPFGQQAEEMLSQIHGGSRVLLTTSCTHALEMSALLLKLEPGDEVIVPAYTFVSTALAFLMHGGKPVFVDVREDTLNIDEDLIEAAITPRTRAICVVNYAGFGVNFDAILALCERYGLLLIEDNAHGLGGTYKGQPLGTFGAMSTLSFHETKNITSGEGGALVLNDPGLIERAEILREKGTNRAHFFRGQVDKYTWVGLGSSWVQSDILAALLASQLHRLEDVNERRRRVWESYATGLSDWATLHGHRLPANGEHFEHTGHLFHVRLRTTGVRDSFIIALKDAGIPALIHYQDLASSSVAREYNLGPEQFPVAQKAANTLIRLPLNYAISDDQVSEVIARACEFLE